MNIPIRNFSRRSFFAGLLNLVAVRAVAGMSAADGDLRNVCRRSVRFPHALALGRCHLKDQGIHAVEAQLAPRLAGIGHMFRTDVAIERLVRDDFRAGRLVRVDGWVLSRTEAAVMAYGAWLRMAA